MFLSDSGRTVTACRSFQLILTGLCSQKCGHCPLPGRYLDPIPPARRIRRILRDAVQRKAVGLEIACGQGIAQSDGVLEACRYYGLNSFIEYLEMVYRCVEQLAIQGPSPLVPIWDLGPLSLAEMRRLRPSLLALKLSLESVDTSLQGRLVFREAPAKAARWELQVLDSAGKARIPTTAVTLVGVGEKPGFPEATLLALAELHRKYGHLQSVCVRGFKPFPGTLMAECPPVEKEALLHAVSAARHILPADVAVQVQAADFPDWTVDLILAGANDLGDIPLQGTPEQYQAVVKWETELGAELARRGIRLKYRLPLYDSALTKGLYPTSQEPRLTQAMASLRNGASPRHPDPVLPLPAAEPKAEGKPIRPVRETERSQRDGNPVGRPPRRENREPVQAVRSAASAAPSPGLKTSAPGTAAAPDAKEKPTGKNRRHRSRSRSKSKGTPPASDA